jgi:hypothetical protein
MKHIVKGLFVQVLVKIEFQFSSLRKGHTNVVMKMIKQNFFQ